MKIELKNAFCVETSFQFERVCSVKYSILRTEEMMRATRNLDEKLCFFTRVVKLVAARNVVVLFHGDGPMNRYTLK